MSAQLDLFDGMTIFSGEEDVVVDTMVLDTYEPTVVTPPAPVEAPSPAEPLAPKTAAPHTGRGTRSASRKIDDFGEEIAGARKHLLREVAKMFSNIDERTLVANPFSKVFKRPDMKKLIDGGILSKDDALFAEAIIQGAVYTDKKPVKEYRIRHWVAEKLPALNLLRDFVLGSDEEKAAIRQDCLSSRWIDGSTTGYEGSLLRCRNRARNTYDIMQKVGVEGGESIELPVRVNYSHGMLCYFDKSYNSYSGVRVEEEDKANTIAAAFAKLQRGDDETVFHPSLFTTHGKEPVMRDTGEYDVYFLRTSNARSVEFKSFSSEEEADALVKKISDGGGAAKKSVRQECAGFEHYTVCFNIPYEHSFIDLEKQFKSEEEAKAFIAEGYEQLSREAIGRWRELKGVVQAGEKKEAFSIQEWKSRESGEKTWRIYPSEAAERMMTGYSVKNNTFATKEEAVKRKTELIGLYEEYLRKRKEIVYFTPPEGERQGEDYRHGRDITPQVFQDTFGFRGVQFGNWTNERDRQKALNEAYDGFMDLSKMIGLEPRALSLGGELGLAFGARGGGSASAHYEPQEVVINLTKTRGSGSLAHEWWHAFDHYMARQMGYNVGYLSEIAGKNKLRGEDNPAYNAFYDMYKLVRYSDYAARSSAIGDYWGSMRELTARLTAEYVPMVGEGKDTVNHFLSRGADEERYKETGYEFYKAFGGEKTYEDYLRTEKPLAGWPYPTKAETKEFAEVMGEVFSASKEFVLKSEVKYKETAKQTVVPRHRLGL